MVSPHSNGTVTKTMWQWKTGHSREWEQRQEGQGTLDKDFAVQAGSSLP